MAKDNKTVLLECISYKNNNPNDLVLVSEDNPYWQKIAKQENIAAKMYDYLRKENRLNDICEYITEHVAENTGDLLVDFVIDKSKLSEEFIEEMEQKFPGNGLKSVDNWRGDDYTGFKGIAQSAVGTYRDWYGTIGRAFEHPCISAFYPGTVEKIAEICTNQSMTAGAIATIKTLWDEEGGVDAQTAEEYDKLVALYMGEEE